MQSTDRPIPTLRLAAVWLAVVAAFAVSAGVARANQLVTITFPDRHREIPSKWLSYQGPPRADVLLPDRYDPHKRYPLIVLLPGFSNTYAILGPTMLDARQVLAGLQAIVVAPEGETGWYVDWFNNGAYGTPKWESYILDEVIPQSLDRYKILSQRGDHALFGISMGGLGAAYLGGRLPGFFGSIAVLSGFVDLQIAPDVVSVGMDALSGVPSGSVVGPESGFYTTGHNPTALVANLQYTREFMSVGNGVPTAADGTGGGVGNAEEAGVIRPMSDARAEGRPGRRHVPDARWLPLLGGLPSGVAQRGRVGAIQTGRRAPDGLGQRHGGDSRPAVGHRLPLRDAPHGGGAVHAHGQPSADQRCRITGHAHHQPWLCPAARNTGERPDPLEGMHHEPTPAPRSSPLSRIEEAPDQPALLGLRVPAERSRGKDAHEGDDMSATGWAV